MKSRVIRIACVAIVLSCILLIVLNSADTPKRSNVCPSTDYTSPPWEEYDLRMTNNYSDPYSSVYDDGTFCYKYTTLTNGTLAIIAVAAKSPSEATEMHVPSKIYGKTVTQIASEAGYYLDTYPDLQIHIPDTIVSIGSYAFCGARARYVYIPESVRFIGQGSFSGSELLGIFVDDNNEAYYDEDGVLFTKDRQQLILFPHQKFSYINDLGEYNFGIYTVPNTVTSIEPYAFNNCYGLSEVILPTGLTDIDQNAFSQCRYMKRVYLPFGLTEIRREAFAYCSRLEYVSIPSSVTSIAPDAFYKDSYDEDAVPLTIACAEDSAAQRFCKKNGIEYIIDPDVDSAVSPNAEIVRGNLMRLSGDNRILTAKEISTKGWNSADTVVIANGFSYPDALAGAPLAGIYDAPMLLTSGNIIEYSVYSEIERLGATNVIILGGESAVSKAVEDELAQRCSVTRISGADRYKTAEQIAQAVIDAASDCTRVFVVSAENYPDALSVSPVAVYSESAIVFSNKKGEITPSLSELLANNSINEAVIVGGASAIGESCEEQLTKCGIENITRINGSNRYETSLKTADYFDETSDGCGTITFATGTNYPDALAGGVFAAQLKAPIILLNPNAPELPAVSDFIDKIHPGMMFAFGGSAVLPNKAIDQYTTYSSQTDDYYIESVDNIELTGRVVYAGGDTGCQEIDVSIYEQVGGELRYLTSATTDTDGRFTASNVLPDECCTSLFCEVVASGYGLCTLTTSINPISKHIDLGTLCLEEQFGYVEVLVTECGEPVEEATVTLWKVVGGAVSFSTGTATDYTGHCGVGLPEGKYYATADYSYYDEKYSVKDLDLSYTSGCFDIVPGQTITIDMNNGNSGSISCDVRCDGVAVSGATVSLYHGDKLLETKISRIGEYVNFYDLPVPDGKYAEYYTINVSYDSYSVREQVEVRLRNRTEVPVDVAQDENLTEVKVQFDYDETAKLCCRNGYLDLHIGQSDIGDVTDSADCYSLCVGGYDLIEEAVTYVKDPGTSYYAYAGGAIYADDDSGEEDTYFEDSDPVKLDITSGSNQFIVHIGVNSSNKIVLSVEKTA